MEYVINGRNTYQVNFTTKPEGYLDYLNKSAVDEDSPYRKGIPVKVDVTVEMLEGEDLKNVPKAIMSHAVKDVNVAIASTLRPLAGRGSFEERYDTLKTKLAEPLVFSATIEAAKRGAREKISPTGKVLDRLLKAYGAVKVAPHLVAIAKEIEAGADEQETLMKYATMFEKKNLKQTKMNR